MTALRTALQTILRWTLCLAILPAIACQDAGSLGPDPASASGDDAGLVVAISHDALPVPFKGRFAATERTLVNPPPAGCEVLIRETDAGEFAHLGRSTGNLTLCTFNGQFGVSEPPFNPGGGPPPYFVTDYTVQGMYTAANGDLLNVSGTGVLVQSLVDGASGLVGAGVVEGGTGRFAGASGEFDVFGARGEVAFDGWIVYDASNRSDPPYR